MSQAGGGGALEVVQARGGTSRWLKVVQAKGNLPFKRGGGIGGASRRRYKQRVGGVTSKRENMSQAGGNWRPLKQQRVGVVASRVRLELEKSRRRLEVLQAEQRSRRSRGLKTT